jgi:integrase
MQAHLDKAANRGIDQIRGSAPGRTKIDVDCLPSSGPMEDSQLLKANGEDVKTVQELLRHANSRITLDVYVQAVNATKRDAQSKVLRMMIPGVGQMGEQEYPQTAV